MKNFLFSLLFIVYTDHLLSQISFQQPIGPEGTLIRALAKDSSGNYYAAGSKIYKSTDQGSHWTVLHTATNWSTIAVTKTGVLYAGTMNGGAVMRSTDNGQTWNYALGNFGMSIHCISVDQWGAIYVGSNNGLFKSTDGVNFVYIESVFTNIVYDLDFNPDGVFFAATMSGIFKSTDFGATWKYLNTSYANTSALKKNTNGIYFAVTSSGIYRSDNRCSTWTKVNDATPAYKMVITIDNAIYVGGFNTLQRSTDGGLTWFNLINTVSDKYIQDIFVPSQSSLLLGNRIGVFVSTNQGNNWQSLNTGLGIVLIRDFVVAPNGHYFVGTGGGVFRSKDEGITWNAINSGLIYQSIYMINVFSDGTLFTSPDNGLYRSTNNGNDWVLMTNGLPETDITTITSTPAGALLASGPSIFRSTNNGDSWTNVYSNINFGTPNSFAEDSTGKIYGADASRIILSTDDGVTWREHYRSFYRPNDLVSNGVGHLFLTDDYNGIFRSLNEGSNWTQVTDAPNNTHMMNVVINKNGYVYASNDVGDVFESKSNGKQWQLVAAFPGKRITELRLDSAGYLYVVISSSGIYKSTTSTTSSDLPNIFVAASYDLGRKRINQQHDTTITIYNIGHDTLKVHSQIITDSIITLRSATFSIPPYRQFFDSINYKLPVIGYRNEELFIGHNALTQIETVAVSVLGHGIPKLRFSNETLDFKIIERNYSKDSSVVVFNDGDDTLKIISKTLSPSSFKSQISFTLIPQGTSVVDSIRFIPQTNGTIDGNMIIQSNTEHQYDTLFLEGYGKGYPVLSMGAKNIDFGNVSVGKTKEKVIYFFNPGYDTLKVNAILCNDSTFFPNKTSFVVQPITASVPVTFTYKPHSIGNDSAIVQIYSNNKNGIDTVLLYGVGSTPMSVQNPDILITTFGLDQNFPNPFNPATTISFQLPVDDFVTLKIFDVLGREVMTLINNYRAAGKHTVVLNAENLSTGIYIYTMTSNKFYNAKRMILIK